MKHEKIIKEIKKFLAENANPKIVQKYSRYFKDGYDAYGISQDIWEKQKQHWIDRWKDTLGLDGFLELGDELFKSGKYEEGSLAFIFLLPFQKKWTKRTIEHVGKWLENDVQNWAHTDVICAKLTSPALSDRIILLSDLAKWRESKSKWKRRAVPVTMLILLKQIDDYTPLLDFITPMMMDAQREVHQGLGWFLREAWKIKPKQVESFLLKWKDKAPRLIFQYATEKMTAENKERFRRDKKKK